MFRISIREMLAYTGIIALAVALYIDRSNTAKLKTEFRQLSHEYEVVRTRIESLGFDIKTITENGELLFVSVMPIAARHSLSEN